MPLLVHEATASNLAGIYEKYRKAYDILGLLVTRKIIGV